MIKNYETPLIVSIANIGNTVQSFIPHMENQTFPIEAGGKVSLQINRSEVGLYYEEQANKDLSVVISESAGTYVSSGSYDLSTSQFDNHSSFSSILDSVVVEDNTTTSTYSVIGTLPYSDATPAIGMPAGNRFTARLSNPNIISRDSLPSGKICNVTKVGGQNTNQDYTKAAFEEDGSLVLIVNSEPTSTITVTIDWTTSQTSVYVFTFTNVKLGLEGETLNDIQSLDITLPAQIKLENISENTVNFVPYHENFSVSVNAGDSIIFESKMTNEVIYYLLQGNDKLKVSL